MIFLLMALLAGITVLSFFLNQKNIIAPGVVISGMFFVSTAVAMLNLGVWRYDFRFWTVVVVVTGVLAFVAGGVCVNRFWMTPRGALALEAKLHHNAPKGIDEKEIVISVRTIIILCAVLLVLLVYYGVEIYRLSVAFGNHEGLGGMIKYARDAFVARLDISKLANLSSTFCQCTAYVFCFIVLKNTVYVGWKKYYLFYCLPVALYIPFMILSGARTGFIYLFAFGIVTFIFFFQGKHGWDPRNTKLFIFIGVGAILAFFLIFRLSGFLKDSGVGTTAWKSLSKYTGFSIAGLNAMVNGTPIPNTYFGEHTLDNVYSVLNQLHITNIELTTPFLPFTKLPGGISSNVYTALYRYYQDYTYGGMLLIMFVTGGLYTAGNSYLYHTGRRGFGMVLYAAFYYPLVMISIEDMLLRGIVSTTTVYQIAFYALSYWLFVKGGSGKLFPYAKTVLCRVLHKVRGAGK